MAREMKNSGVRWIGEIPSSWSVKRFKYLHWGANVGETIGKDYWSDDKTDKAFYTAGANNIYSTYMDFPSWKLVGECDLLLSRNGTPYVYLPINGALYTDHIIRVSIKDKLFDKRFIRYCLLRSIEGEKVDVVMLATWSVSIWNAQRIPLPPLSEQKVIADFLDAKCGEIDGLLTDLDAEVKTLTEYKKSIIAETVTRGLNPNAPMKSSGIPWAESIPTHWGVEKFRYKLKPKKIVGQGDKEVLSVYREYGVVIKSSRDDNHNRTSEDTSNYKYVQPNDFVINKMKAWQGSMGVSNYEGIVSPAYFVYSFRDEDYLPKFFHYYMRNANNIPEYRRLSGGIREGQWDLSPYDLGNMPIILPPMDEQIEIANYLDSKCAAIDQAITDKTQQIETLKAYKSSLIYEYVTGKKQVL